MGKIRTLREDVYKKIAAGEVVERPLSVVKELVENSIDAGADTITVEVLDGGKRSIKVIDNGSGMEPDDIETAFKNHATSKITELSDFDSLLTLGFRGEALPSIMEVSKIEVLTANNNSGNGIYCLFEDGQLKQQAQIACPQGTTITVKELFYNFPVRKKFLKTDRTELTQIISFLEPMTLVNYDKSFHLVHNGKTVFEYKKVGQLKERIYQVLGKEMLDGLQEVNYQQNNYHLTGFISRLNTGLTVKKHQYFFINHRAVREKTLVAALNNTFQVFLEKHRSPAALLLMDLPPGEVDVNIHPMKLEIKFVDASAVYQFIKHGIESCFGNVNEFRYAPDIGAFPRAGAPGSISTGLRGDFNDFNVHNDHNNYNRGSAGSALPVNPGSGSSGQYFNSRSFPGQGQRPMPEPADAITGDFEQAQLFAGNFLDQEGFLIIGQYKNSYIIVERGEDLLIVDQHNAQERVNFDELKREYVENNVVSINPLFPVVIELAPSETAGLDSRKMEILNKAGFHLEPLGGNSFDIKSFPQILGERSIKDAVQTVIHMKDKDGETDFEDVVLAEIACKSAIKVNHKLYPDQMKTIVRNLFKTSNPYFCPHKRPIIIEYSLEQIEKLMKRR